MNHKCRLLVSSECVHRISPIYSLLVSIVLHQFCLVSMSTRPLLYCRLQMHVESDEIRMVLLWRESYILNLRLFTWWRWRDIDIVVQQWLSGRDCAWCLTMCYLRVVLCHCFWCFGSSRARLGTKLLCLCDRSLRFVEVVSGSRWMRVGV